MYAFPKLSDTPRGHGFDYILVEWVNAMIMRFDAMKEILG